MMIARLESRLKMIESKVADGDALIDDLDTAKVALTATGDPALERKFKYQIKQAREQISEWETEYADIEAKLSTARASSGAGATSVDSAALGQALIKLNSRLDSLETNVITAVTQTAVTTQETVRSEGQLTREQIAAMTQTLLARYDSTQQELMRAIFERLDASDLKTLDAITGQIDALKPGDPALKEANKDLVEAQEALDTIKNDPTVPDAVKKEIEKVTNEAENQDSNKAKLKLTLPLIPGFLDVSAENFNPKDIRFKANLGIGEVSITVGQALEKLGGLWQRFKKRSEPQAQPVA